jgi:sulfur-oxidizing protein SoxZ
MAKNRLKAKAKKGVIDIKAIIAHPMESGLRKVKGKIVPANHLTNVSIAQNGTTIVNADVNGAISKDPFFKFKVSGKKGDEIVVSYVDNLGKKGTIKKKSK